MFFLRRLRPLEVDGERVRSLRLSLNAPVLSTPDLPVGPARAVIVVHKDSRGRMDATVGVRSQRSGEFAYWSFDGELTSADDLDVAADAALSFAESLGFLFEDDVVSPGSDASKAWRTWLGVGSHAPSALSIDDNEFGVAAHDLLGGGSVPELVLDDLAIEEPAKAAARPAMQVSRAPAPQAGPRATTLPRAVPASLSVAAQPAAQLPQAQPARLAPTRLSKFRAPGEAPAPAPAPAPAHTSSKPKTPVRQPLARVQLVKRRSPEEERKLLLRRLLTSF